ncbi:MAG: hypothetical protein ACE5OY_00820 [Candidatus Bathyarchaeia archaeon]
MYQEIRQTLVKKLISFIKELRPEKSDESEIRKMAVEIVDSVEIYIKEHS